MRLRNAGSYVPQPRGCGARLRAARCRTCSPSPSLPAVAAGPPPPLLLQGQQCPNPVLRPRMGTEQIVDPAHPQGVMMNMCAEAGLCSAEGMIRPVATCSTRCAGLPRAPSTTVPGDSGTAAAAFLEVAVRLVPKRARPRPAGAEPMLLAAAGPEPDCIPAHRWSPHQGVLPSASHLSAATAMSAFGSAAVSSRPSLS